MRLERCDSRRRAAGRAALMVALALLLFAVLFGCAAAGQATAWGLAGSAAQDPLPLTHTLFLPLVSQRGPFPGPQVPITLSTYGWQQALVPSEPSDPFYPYPRLRRELVGAPVSRTYLATVLENEYVRILVLPDIGGRILRWEDKTTGRLLTYANPVIRPTNANWGYRGWWLATGGVEWAFPVEEHGLNEWRPWQTDYQAGAGWRSLRVWDRDDRTGLWIEVKLTLEDGRSDLQIAPRISNPTSVAQPYQFWINAMLTLSPDNRPSPSLRFWLPTPEVIVHSTGYEQPPFPEPRQTMDWPVSKGVDYSRYGLWEHYLGFFATELTGAMGVYDEMVDQGVVRSYPPDVAQGAKFFGLGELGPDIYTDDSSAYFEMWGGRNRTFWPEDYITLHPGGSVGWEERWYPVHGMGTLGWADADLAASLQVSGTQPTTVTVGLHAPSEVSARLVLLEDGEVTETWDVWTDPTHPFRAEYTGAGRDWALEVWRGGTLVTTITETGTH